MKARLKTFMLTLGVVGLLGLPVAGHSGDGIQATGHDPVGSKEILLAGSGSLVVTGSKAPAAPETPQTATPEVVVTKPLFDFGRVLDGTEVSHAYLLENRGSGDLAIEKVLTG